MNNNGNGNNRDESRPEQQNETENAVRVVISAARKSVPGQMLRNLLEEMFPWLYSQELFKNSLHRLFSSLKTEPCSTLFYLLLVVFGFVPFLCFFLFIGGAFILSVVWFAVCQAVTIMVAALVFGAFMIFLILMCSSIASIFGLIIHLLYGWRSLTEVISELVQCLFTLSTNFLTQLRRKKDESESLKNR